MAEKLYKVIAEADVSGDKLKGCRIVDELTTFDNDYVHVHGPFPLEECRKWARNRCAEVSEG